MHILISGGGTGGGVYPAIAVARALQAQQPDVKLRWPGSSYGIERDLIEREGIAFDALPGGPIVGVGLKAIPNALRILLATFKARRIIREFKPDALLITGGWPTIAPTLAAWLSGVPVMIYLPDLEPAAAIKVLANFAQVVAVNAEESAAYFKAGQAFVSGYPLRPAVLEAAGYDILGQPIDNAEVIQAQARERFNLIADLPMLLVFGGSRGARSINHALLKHLPDLLTDYQIIHISGTLDAAQVEADTADLSPEHRNHYHLFAYLHSEDMALALATADLVVSRAGAGTLGEFPIFQLPAILVPYPHAWRYQKNNADYLATRGAAVRLDDEKLANELGDLVRDLLNDPQRRAQMAQAAAELAHPDAAAIVAERLAASGQTIV